MPFGQTAVREPLRPSRRPSSALQLLAARSRDAWMAKAAEPKELDKDDADLRR
jgi:hypothetical protein